MAKIQDHAYLKLCADLASILSVSLSSAKRRVELASIKEGVKDLENHKKIAKQLIQKAKSDQENGKISPARELDKLLESLSEEDNFMVED